MRIACPSCGATYEVPASRLKPGKMVRCARCGSDWLPEAEAAAAPPQPRTAPFDPTGPSDPTAPVDPTALPGGESEHFADGLPEITAMDRLAASPALLPSRAGLIAAWVLTVAVLAGAAAAVFGWRDTVVRAWPPSGRILATIGHTTAPAVQSAGKKVE
jgi:predicted Zn finger-like uncharacterized protein